MSRVLLCTCRNAWQDVRYGSGMRVHSRTKQSKAEAERRWRCSVCSDEKS